MKTKKIILIRHGDYISDEACNLSENGKNDIRKLAIKLLPEIRGKELLCITSIANRGKQSAEILQEIWRENGVSVDFEKKYEIWSGTDAYKEARRLLEHDQKSVSVYDTDWLKEFITTANQEVVIVVTHLEFVERFPVEFGFSNRTVAKGQARIVDLENHKDSLIE